MLMLMMMVFRMMWMVMDWVISVMRTQIVMMLLFRYMYVDGDELGDQ
jgi:hypothetical protein